MISNNLPLNQRNPLLEKFIRAATLSAFRRTTTFSNHDLSRHLKTYFSFDPFKTEFNALSWEDIIVILKSGDSAQWFSFTTTSIMTSVKPKALSHLYGAIKDNLKFLEQVPILELAKALAKGAAKEMKSLTKARNWFEKKYAKFQRKQAKILSEMSKTLQNSVQNQTSNVITTEPIQHIYDDVVFVNSNEIAERFLSDIERNHSKKIAFNILDTKPMLVQISANGYQYVFDLTQELNQVIVVDAVKKVLEDETMTKIAHLCDKDLNLFFTKLGVDVRNIADIYFLHQEISKQSEKSLTRICEKYGVNGMDKAEFLKNVKVVGNTKEIIDCAAASVRFMIPLFDTMVATIPLDQQDNVLTAMMKKSNFYSVSVNSVAKLKSGSNSIEQSSQIKESNELGLKIDSSNLHDSKSATTNPVSCTTTIINQIDTFLELFPKHIKEELEKVSGEDISNLIEVAMDKGRPYELFYYHKKESFSDPSFVVTQEEIDQVVGKVSFGTDNRAGIDGSLHRISAMLNRSQQIIGLTLRVGRAVMGRSKVFADLIEQGKSILLLGKPGSGKTTFIRDFAKTISESRRVVVVDTSCEIGGFGDIPHIAIGKARRMQVADIRRQQEVMIQAVQNHTPEVIVIDEIGTREEVSTARTIAQRGICLCGSAHGDMKTILKNPILCDLLGGVESVIMSDRNATKDGEKMRLQLKADPVFDVVIQLPDDSASNEWRIFTDLRTTVQNILAKRQFKVEIRKLEGDVLTSSQLIIT